jgi:flagellar basal-body rod protein FlgC
MQEKLTAQVGNGVRVKEIRELTDAESPYRRVYEPSHPDADEQGYVSYPNVNIVEEMINMISATRAYEANAKAIEATKSMAARALEIGR